MPKIDPKVLSEAGLEAIAAIAGANPSEDVFVHIEKKFKAGMIDYSYFEILKEAYQSYLGEMDLNIYSGIRTSISPPLGDLALSNEANNRSLNQPLSTIHLDIRYVEENKDIGQERQIPVTFSLGKEKMSINDYAQKYQESSEDCHVKLLGIWAETWLQTLGLDYDYEKSTIVDKKTSKVPTKEEFEEKISEMGQDAEKRFYDKAKKSGLLEKNGEILVGYVAFDFNNRERAEPISP